MSKNFDINLLRVKSQKTHSLEEILEIFLHTDTQVKVASLVLNDLAIQKKTAVQLYEGLEIKKYMSDVAFYNLLKKLRKLGMIRKEEFSTRYRLSNAFASKLRKLAEDWKRLWKVKSDEED